MIINTREKFGGIQMLWEMLYCVVFFLLPLVGMFTAIVVRAFSVQGEAVDEIEDQIENDVDVLRKIRVAVGDVCNVGDYYEKMRPHETLDQGALVIDFKAYRELGIIRVLKRRMYSRDGPGDSS